MKTCQKSFSINVTGAANPLAWFPMGEVGNVDRIDVINGIPINPTAPVGTLNAAGKIQAQGVEFSVVGAGQSGLLGDGVSFGFPQSLVSGLSIVMWAKWRSAWNPNVHIRFADFQIYGPGPGFNLNFDLKLLWGVIFGFSVQLDQFGLPQNAFNSAFLPVVGTWYFLHVYYDGATGKIGVSVNNGVPVQSIGFGGLIGGFDSSINDIYLEDDTGQVVLSEYGIFPYKLTATQLTFLYNAGVGKTWPFVLPP